jgi:hypothetical protein
MKCRDKQIYSLAAARASYAQRLAQAISEEFNFDCEPQVLDFEEDICQICNTKPKYIPAHTQHAIRLFVRGFCAGRA